MGLLGQTDLDRITANEAVRFDHGLKFFEPGHHLLGEQAHVSFGVLRRHAGVAENPYECIVPRPIVDRHDFFLNIGPECPKPEGLGKTR